MLMQTSQGGESVDMDEKIKSYRQAIFKLDHAERKRGEELPSKYSCTTNKQSALKASCRCVQHHVCIVA